MSKKHPEKSLSPARVRTVTDPGMYSDGNCLYLVVDPSGAKRWMLRVTIQGRRRDVGLGGLKTVSLAAARDKATEWRRKAREGADPLAERRRERMLKAMPSFEVIAREVHQSHSQSFRNDKHRGQWISSLEEYVFPKIGSRRVDELQPSDVLTVLSPIWLTKSETARRIRQRMKIVFNFAKAKGYRSGDNPLDGISEVLPKHSEKQKHHAALSYSAVPQFIEGLRAAPSVGLSVRLAFEFLILNASRTSEVLLARWDEIDIDNKTWTIPADRMKAGEEHRVPLSPRCLEVLEEAGKISDGGPYVFPGRAQGRALSNMAFIMALRHMKHANITPHGFRSTFRDWCEESGFGHNVAEAALAHTIKDKTEKAYIRTKLFDKRIELMVAWARFATTKPLTKVVKIRG